MKSKKFAAALASCGLAVACTVVATAGITLTTAPEAQAAPYACTTWTSGRNLGWYADGKCVQGWGAYRTVAKCNGLGGTARGTWQSGGYVSSAWCGWWGVSSSWIEKGS